MLGAGSDKSAFMQTRSRQTHYGRRVAAADSKSRTKGAGPTISACGKRAGVCRRVRLPIMMACPHSLDHFCAPPYAMMRFIHRFARYRDSSGAVLPARPPCQTRFMPARVIVLAVVVSGLGGCAGGRSLEPRSPFADKLPGWSVAEAFEPMDSPEVLPAVEALPPLPAKPPR